MSGSRGAQVMQSARGFTLVEMLVVLAVGVVLLSTALPSFAEHWRQARRSDAVVALTKLQIAQERYRAHHGIYAADFMALKTPSLSEAGYYELRLEGTQAHSYTARAAAVADGPQASDTACASLTLDVNDGMAQPGPNSRCWNR